FALQRANRVNLKLSTADQRKAKLQKLRDAILAHAEEIDEALFLDLRKERLGATNSELTPVLERSNTPSGVLARWWRRNWGGQPLRNYVRYRRDRHRPQWSRPVDAAGTGGAIPPLQGQQGLCEVRAPGCVPAVRALEFSVLIGVCPVGADCSRGQQLHRQTQ